jgi:cell division protease FtsH
MKFSSSALLVLGASAAMLDSSSAFTVTVMKSRSVGAMTVRRQSALHMAMDAPPAATAATEIPVIQSRNGAPVDVRYSDFLKLVNGDRLEKVTFNADGTKLLGVDTDGVRIKIEALPNDPDLLTQLTTHKVRKPEG